MATCNLKDTGYYSTDGSTQLTGSGNVANNGNPIVLKVNSIKYGVGLQFDDKPATGNFDGPKLGFISFPAPTIIVNGYVTKKGDVSNTNNILKFFNDGVEPTLIDENGDVFTDEVRILGLLAKCAQTKGYKEFYYDDSTNDNIFWGMGIVTSRQSLKHFIVRVKGFTVNDVPNTNQISYTLTLEVTS